MYALIAAVMMSGIDISDGMAGANEITECGATAVLGANFSLDSAYDKGASLGNLDSNSGTQTYQVPKGVSAPKYREVYIWCLRFGVLLGVARLK